MPSSQATNDVIQLRITQADGTVRTVTVDADVAFAVQAGESVEVVSAEAVRQAVIAGGDLKLVLPDGKIVLLEGYVEAIKSKTPLLVNLPEPRQLTVRVVREDGTSVERRMVPGEQLELGAGERIEITGTTIPMHYKQQGSTLTFVNQVGETFAFRGVVNDSVPLVKKVSFPDIFQFGSVIDGGAGNFPLQLLPLQFSTANFTQAHNTGGAVVDGQRTSNDIAMADESGRFVDIDAPVTDFVAGDAEGLQPTTDLIQQVLEQADGPDAPSAPNTQAPPSGVEDPETPSAGEDPVTLPAGEDPVTPPAGEDPVTPPA